MGEFVMKRLVAAQVLATRVRGRAEVGQAMVEYAAILAFVTILVLVALRYLEPQISVTLNTVSNSL